MVEQANTAKCVTVFVQTPYVNENTLNEYIKELNFLIQTLGAESIKSFVQKMSLPDNKTYVGSGKLYEIQEYIQNNEIEYVVFDDELTPAQLRNIESILKCNILDRTQVILNIFAIHAKTSHARVQVELAQYKYLLPRLKRMWTHLDRQKGGLNMRGPGETQIETDRRIVLNNISILKQKLIKINKTKAIQKKNRQQLIHVSLVGYTNVGKSTIFNMLSKSDVISENKLFATLDTTIRKVVIDNLPFLLSDTVGFIRKLPPTLLESFVSTLDEVKESDLLIHVVDISSSNFEAQMNEVTLTLNSLDAADKDMIIVFNKTDAFTYIKKDADDLTEKQRYNFSLEDWKKTYLNNSKYPVVFISAKNKGNIDKLKQVMYDKIKVLHAKIYPYNSFLY